MSTPTPSVKVDICRRALSRLGENLPVANIKTPTTVGEQQCALWYDQTVRDELNMRDWVFARKSLVLKKDDRYTPTYQEGDQPLPMNASIGDPKPGYRPDYAAAYVVDPEQAPLLPRALDVPDYVQSVNPNIADYVRDVDDGTGQGRILTFIDFGPTLRVVFTKLDTTENLWPSYFVQLVVAALAVNIAPGVTASIAIRDQVIRELQFVRTGAYTSDGRSERHYHDERPNWIAVRSGILGPYGDQSVRGYRPPF